MTMQSNTLRPGLLVSLKTSIVGNVRYDKRTIEAGHVTEEGTHQERWETERTISDPAEHEAGIKARSKARSLIAAACASSAFGLLCPEANADDLEKAVAAARAVADGFNAVAKLSKLNVYVITGRIAPDDVEAVKAINGEVRELLEAMACGIANLDVKVVRDAAGRAKSLGAMLSPTAAARIQMAIDAARGAARKIVAAGEQAAQEIDRKAIRAVTEARTSFLDLEPAKEVAAPTEEGRALDLFPTAPTIGPVPASVPAVELE